MLKGLMLVSGWIEVLFKIVGEGLGQLHAGYKWDGAVGSQVEVHRST